MTDILAKLPLWKHQEDAYRFAYNKPGVLLGLEPGCGKSAVAVALITNNRHKKILVTCPLSVVPVWRREFEKHSPCPIAVLLLDSEDSIKRRTERASEFLLKHREETAAIVINHEALWRDPFASWALDQRFDTVIADECVLPETMIATPHGPRCIDTLAIGDSVYGRDDVTGRLIVTHVRHVFSQRTSSPLYQINNTFMTGNHPIATRDQYVPAQVLDNLSAVWYIDQKEKTESIHEKYARVQMVSQSVFAARKNATVLRQEMCDQMAIQYLVPGKVKNIYHGYLRMVPHAIPETQCPIYQETVLRQELFCQMAYEKLPAHCDRQNARSVAFLHDQPQTTGRCTEKTSGSFIFPIEPGSLTTEQGQSNHSSTRERLCSPHWGEWDWTNSSSAIACAQVGMENGTCRENWSQQIFTNSLQNRHRGADTQNWNRSRRVRTFVEENQIRRHAQNAMVGGARLDNGSLHQQTSDDKSFSRSFSSARPYQVYNIETGSGNYFANGLLVHNCHRAKKNSGKLSLYLMQLGKTVRQRVGLTGTPMPHDFSDIFAQCRFLDPRVFGYRFAPFRNRYAKMGGFQAKKIVGFLPGMEEEFNHKLSSIMYVVKKQDALDLPEELHVVRTCTLSDKSQSIYRDLSKRFHAEVLDGTVTAANAGVKLLRLQQITSGHIRLDDEQETKQIGTEKEDLLRDLAEDLQEPLVVFCRFVADLAAVQRVSESLHLRYGEISGKRKDLTTDATMPGNIDVLGVQIQAGGVGIDLTRSATAIDFSLTFNLAEYLQTRARLHRPGQTRKVTYIHLVAENTVDEYISQCLQNRENVIEKILANIKAEQQKAA